MINKINRKMKIKLIIIMKFRIKLMNLKANKTIEAEFSTELIKINFFIL
jgi:hypothetical protein